MFCEGVSGGGRQITYIDVLKDFGFMEAKGFHNGFIQGSGTGGVNSVLATQGFAVSSCKNTCRILDVPYCSL